MGIQFTQVRKSYRSAPQALHDVSFEADSGVTVLLGPPGSGKSTVLSLIATLEKPSAGVVLVDGCDVRKQAAQVRRRVGLLPKEGEILPDLTVGEMFEYLAMLCNLDQPAARQLRIGRVLERFDLTVHRDRRIRTLTPGTRRLAAVAQTCLGQVTTLLFDEPTRGLDGADAWTIRTWLASLGRDFVVVTATTDPAEAEAIADQVVILHDGRIAANGSPAKLKHLVAGQVWSLELETVQPRDTRGMVLSGLVRLEDRTVLRGLAPTCPHPAATTATPNLEDVYVWLLARNSGVVASPLETPAPADLVGTPERSA